MPRSTGTPSTSQGTAHGGEICACFKISETSNLRSLDDDRINAMLEPGTMRELSLRNKWLQMRRMKNRMGPSWELHLMTGVTDTPRNGSRSKMPHLGLASESSPRGRLEKV